MRQYRLAAVTVILWTLTASMAVAQARQMGGIGITVYDDPNFRGRNANFRTAITNLQRTGMNDRISSLEVAPGEYWEACEHDNFRGRCQVFSGTESNLRQRGWNDMISSLRPVNRWPGGPTAPPTYPPYPGRPPVAPGPYPPQGLVLYTGVNFTGGQQVFTSGVPDLRRVNFDNRAASLRLPPGQVWEVCRDRNYRNCLQVNTDWPTLRNLNMYGQISSLRPRSDVGGGGGWQQPYPQQPLPPYPGQSAGRAILYDRRNFSGQAFTATAVHGSLGRLGGRAESLRVEGGLWEVCDGVNFSGRCVSFNQDVYDLRQYGLHNRIRSIRRIG